jgi:HAMP domain-containing protein
VVSFKVKLAVYFLLLSLLPVAAAFWGFSSVASQSETRRVDARLQGGLRAALAAYQERLDTAQVTAETLAREPAFQEALSRSDRRTVSRRLRGLANVEVLTPLGLVVGRNPGFAAKRQVDVFSRNGLFVGTVIAFVPYDTRLATRLHSLSGLPANDSVAILDGTHIAAASPAVFGRLTLAPGLTRSVGVGGARYRALVAGSLQEDPLAGARLAVLSPQNVIDRANGSTRTRLLLFLVGSLLIVAIVAWIEGRSIVRTLRDLVHAAHAIARGRLDERVPLRGRDEFSQLGRAFNDMADQLEERLQELEAERARLREAFARIGDALGSTHDPAGLLQVVLETALQATGATGAVLVGDRGEHVEVGDPAQGPERLEVPLSAGQTSFGTLVLTGSGFSEEQKLTAISLAAQAVVALEKCPPAPHRRAPGARRSAHGARQPAALRGGPVGRAREGRALRHAPHIRPRRPRRLQDRQ